MRAKDDWFRNSSLTGPCLMTLKTCRLTPTDIQDLDLSLHKTYPLRHPQLQECEDNQRSARGHRTRIQRLEGNLPGRLLYARAARAST